MTIQELNTQYYFHDSMITNVSYSAETQRLIFIIEFCNWAQEWYKEGEPELLKMEIVFEGITDYDGIVGDIDYFSILDADIKEGKYHLLIEDDFHQKTYEYFLSPTNVEIKIVGIVED